MSLASDRLNEIIIAKADALPAGWHAAPAAPDSFVGLLASSAADGGHITVWTGGSDRTVYGSPHVNHAFRAWHDSLHITLLADFTLTGERKVALAQAEACERPEDAALLLADVLGQAEYYVRHGAFPEDQIAFVASYLRDRDAALRKAV